MNNIGVFCEIVRGQLRPDQWDTLQLDRYFSHLEPVSELGFLAITLELDVHKADDALKSMRQMNDSKMAAPYENKALRLAHARRGIFHQHHDDFHRNLEFSIPYGEAVKRTDQQQHRNIVQDYHLPRRMKSNLKLLTSHTSELLLAEAGLHFQDIPQRIDLSPNRE